MNWHLGSHSLHDQIVIEEENSEIDNLEFEQNTSEGDRQVETKLYRELSQQNKKYSICLTTDFVAPKWGGVETHTF